MTEVQPLKSLRARLPLIKLLPEPGRKILDPNALEGEHVEAGSAEVPWVVLPFLRAPSTDLNMTLRWR